MELVYRAESRDKYLLNKTFCTFRTQKVSQI